MIAAEFAVIGDKTGDGERAILGGWRLLHKSILLNKNNIKTTVSRRQAQRSVLLLWSQISDLCKNGMTAA